MLNLVKSLSIIFFFFALGLPLSDAKETTNRSKTYNYKAVSSIDESDCVDEIDHMGALKSYVLSYSESDVKMARKALVLYYRDMNCDSAKKFAHHRRAFKEALSVMKFDQEQEVMIELLAPIAYLLINFNGSHRDDSIRHWLNENQEYLKARYAQDRSWLNLVGLATPAGGDLRRTSMHEFESIMESLGHAWSSGLCTAAEMVMHEGSLICPYDCLTEFGENRDFIKNANLNSSEAELLCDEISDKLSDAEWPEPDSVTQCLEQFAADTRSHGIQACLIDLFIKEREVQLFPSLDEVESNVVVSRDCWISQSDEEESDAELLERLERELEEAEQAESDAEIEWLIEFIKLNLQSDTNIGPLADDQLRKQAERVRAADAAENAAEAARKEAERKLEEERQRQKSGGGSNQYCDPDSDGCSGSCGPQDEHLASLAQCYSTGRNAQPTDPLDPADPIDPRVIMPDPETDPDAPAAIKELAQCLIGSSGKNSGSSCSKVLSCDNDAEPFTDENGFCTCPADSIQLVPQNRCEEVIMCSEDGPCTCEGMPVEVPTGVGCIDPLLGG